MTVVSKKELDTHRYHDVTLIGYLIGGCILECRDCSEVLLEFHDDKFGMIQLGVHDDSIDNFDDKERT